VACRDGDQGEALSTELGVYLRDISREPLLTASEEVALARKIQGAAREARAFAWQVPDVLRSIARLGQLETGDLITRYEQTERAWREFRAGRLLLDEYRELLAGTAELLERRVVPSEVPQGYAIRSASLDQVRELGAEAQQLGKLTAGVCTEAGKEAVRRWEDEHLLPVSLAIEIAEGSATAFGRAAEERARLCEGNLRLVVAFARERRSDKLPLSDLVSLGNEGLLAAVERYDDGIGARFSTYAGWWLKQAMCRGAQEEERTIRLPWRVEMERRKLDRHLHRRTMEEGRSLGVHEGAAELGWSAVQTRNILGAPRRHISLDAPTGEFEDGRSGAAFLVAPGVSTGFTREELEPLTRRISQVLDPRQRTVLALLLGLSNVEGMLLPPGASEGETQSLREVGALFGLTHERVRQIYFESLKVLSNAMVLEYAGSRVVRYAERALLPGQQLLVFAALEPGCPPLTELLRDPLVRPLYHDGPAVRRNPELRAVRLLQDALERLAEQVVVDELRPGQDGRILDQLTDPGERFFFEEFWLGPAASIGELLVERGKAVIRVGLPASERGLERVRRKLHEEVLAPQIQSFLKDHQAR